MIHVFSTAAKAIGKKVESSSLSKDDQSSTVKRGIDSLCIAKVLTKVQHSHCHELPLLAEANEHVYQLIFLDVGITNTKLGLDRSSVSGIPDETFLNEGSLAEQFFGQHPLDLLSSSPNRHLHYWLREGKDANDHMAR